MSTAYQTNIVASKVGASSGFGINRQSTHLHAISPTISTWAAGDTIAVGNLPAGAVVTNVIMKAASQLDSNGAPTLALDLGVTGATQLFKAAVTTVGHADAASVDTTNTAGGYLSSNQTGADLAVIATVHTAAATAVAGTLEFDVEYYVEPAAGSNPEGRPVTLEERVKRLPGPEQIFHWAMMAGVTLIVALLGWFGSQLVGMRDDIHTLKDELPALQAQIGYVQSSLSDRLNRVETRVDKLDDDAMERAR